ncbi:hypothetical protein CEXT_78641 [Caerostris extrusa]|uniref:Uncharacterized protein n=1 Tax=Caerostris extrusa TaxID=172846 RepID=A0AAV4P4D0_CAEEX|nr:hypothetical protein CEXT_78641 [Caerostris extrusa]
MTSCPRTSRVSNKEFVPFHFLRAIRLKARALSKQTSDLLSFLYCLGKCRSGSQSSSHANGTLWVVIGKAFFPLIVFSFKTGGSLGNWARETDSLSALMLVGN